MKRSARDFEEFKSHCEQWRRRLGLLDWHFRYEFQSRSGTSESTVWIDGQTRNARFAFYRDPEGGAVFPVDRVAAHEVLHVLLNDSLKASAARGSDMHDDALKAEHACIERLLTVLVDDQKKGQRLWNRRSRK